jgi:CubicO group peptidase (beta-lactamase class C family)
MRTTSLVLATLAACAAPCLAAASAPDLRAVVVKPGAGARLDQQLASLTAAGFAGTVLVARDGEILLHKGYGMADKERKIPCDTETVFDIGSITKQFTAAAILKLETAGKLATTDRLDKYFPDAPKDKAGITLHQLLTHTSGLDHGYGEDTDYAPRDLALSVFMKMPLLTPPGEKYRYSNAGFSILAAIVEKVTGGTYERYLRDTFFAPAGMTQTGYVLPAWDMKHLTRNYSGEKDNGFTFNRSWGPDGPYWHCYGNGCILSTAADLYRWEQALQTHAALPPEARRKLWTPYAPVGEEGKGSYAYGWRVGKVASGATFIGHGGGSDFGVWCAFYRFPEEHLLVLVLSHQLPVPGGQDQAEFVGRLAAVATAP